MEIVSFGITDTGKVRTNNEDAMLLEEGQGLFVVADGMGGHNCGEVASSMAIGILRDTVCRPEQKVAIVGGVDHRLSIQANIMASAIRLANRVIFEAAASDPKWQGMGTTVASVLISEDKAVIAHVGDSRVYLLRNGEMSQLTEDHSLVAEQLRKGAITAEEAALSIHKNIITRALGHEPEVLVDISELEVRDGDFLLLCSDGLSGMLSDQEIAALIQAHSHPEPACRDLVSQANAAGGRDNITAIVVELRKNSGFMAGVKRMFRS